MIPKKLLVNQLSSPAKIFCYFLICFIAGVGLASFVPVDFFWAYLLGLAVLLGVLFVWPKPIWRWLLLGALFLMLGIFRYQFSLPQTAADKIWFYNGQAVQVKGVVFSEPDIRSDHAKIIILVSEIFLADEKIKVSGKLLTKVNLFPSWQYGDELVLNCRLKAPAPINGFAYDRYLAKDNIYALCYYPSIKLISTGNGHWLLGKIFAFKNSLRAAVSQNLPEPHASLFFGINFGSRGGIPQALTDDFNATGTTHLIAISGMNITIICGLLIDLFLACGLPRKKSFGLVTASLILFIILIGWPASATRAAVMGWLVVLAATVGRKNKINYALIFSAAAMIAVNPKILRTDVGFQLSFLAVIGLVYFQPFFSRRLSWVPEGLGLRDALSLTLAAQVTTLPLIIYNFGRISLLAPLVNLFAVPVMLYLMLVGFLAVGLSLIFPPAGAYFFLPVWLMTNYLIKIIEWFSGFAYAAINV